jgi:putative chitinase
MLIGQCAHESIGFKTRFENLNYSGDGLWKTFRSHFASRSEAEAFKKQPEKIANRVYSDRMGNGSEASGDGWRYRGRGFVQLTGRSNYRIYGGLLDIDLEGAPERAADIDLCWMIAASFVARTRRSGKTLLQWADVPNAEMVTRGINGGVNGLQDRKVLTGRAYAALTGRATTAEWQSLLLNAGFEPGPIDGLKGPKTQAAMAKAEDQFGATGDALLKILRAIT